MSQDHENTCPVIASEKKMPETNGSKRKLEDNNDKHMGKKQRSNEKGDAIVRDNKEIPENCFLCQRNILDTKDK